MMSAPTLPLVAAPLGGVHLRPGEAGSAAPLGRDGWLDGLPVLVLGLGDSGLAMARWCARHGAQVTVWDSREAPPQGKALVANVPAAKRLSGGLHAESPAPFKLVLKSPGLAPHEPQIAPLLQQARATGIAVLGELDLYVRALADLKAAQDYAPDLLAITGTNGKTTVTAMTRALVERGGRTVVAAGNIGPTLLDTLATAIDTGALPQVWVLELSSFQLAGGSGDGVTGFEPTAAALLNLTQDHIDWHGSMAAYARAKQAVFGSTAALVINRDDPALAPLLPVPPPVKGKAKPATRTVIRFGLDAPRRPGDFGLVTENGMAWLVRAMPADETIKRRPNDTEPEIHLQRLMPADALRVRGRHNTANALAALALATTGGQPIGPMLHALQEYEGEPHRLQHVACIGAVDAYDDSKATNVGATVAALEGLGAERAPGKLIVILGGDGKGQDFTPLRAPVERHVRAVATIGRDAAAIEAAVDPVALRRHDTLEDATVWCFEQARPGDAVLLSPACASLDMFSNYAHRGDVFAMAVQALANEAGQL